MFNDVWKESILSGSFYNNEQAFGPWGRPTGFGQRLEWRRAEQWWLERRRLEQWELGTVANNLQWRQAGTAEGWNARQETAAMVAGRSAWRGDWAERLRRRTDCRCRQGSLSRVRR